MNSNSRLCGTRVREMADNHVKLLQLNLSRVDSLDGMLRAEEKKMAIQMIHKHHLEIALEALAAFCEYNQIRKLREALHLPRPKYKETMCLPFTSRLRRFICEAVLQLPQVRGNEIILIVSRGAEKSNRILMLKLHKTVDPWSGDTSTPHIPAYIRNLTDAYQPHLVYWEVVECFRKIILVIFPALLSQVGDALVRHWFLPGRACVLFMVYSSRDLRCRSKLPLYHTASFRGRAHMSMIVYSSRDLRCRSKLPLYHTARQLESTSPAVLGVGGGFRRKGGSAHGDAHGESCSRMHRLHACSATSSLNKHITYNVSIDPPPYRNLSGAASRFPSLFAAAPTQCAHALPSLET